MPLFFQILNYRIFLFLLFFASFFLFLFCVICRLSSQLFLYDLQDSWVGRYHGVVEIGCPLRENRPLPRKTRRDKRGQRRVRHHLCTSDPHPYEWAVVVLLAVEKLCHMQYSLSQTQGFLQCLVLCQRLWLISYSRKFIVIVQ